MADIDRLLDEVHRLGTLPPASRPAVEAVIERGLRRRRARRVRMVLGGAVVVAAVAGSALSLMGDDGTELHASNGGPPATEAGDGAPAALRVDPDTDLADGQVVVVTFTPDESVDFLVQCASEAVRAADPVPWCDINGRAEPVEGEPGTFKVTVERSIQTTQGLIDCAERPGRCILGVRTPNDDYTAPISFRDDLGPIPVPVLTVEGATAVADGDRLTVRGAGFVPGDEIFIKQCRVNNVEGGTEGCDTSREVQVTAEADGSFRVEMLVFHEIFGDVDGWYPCQPCVLHAGASGRAATEEIEIAPGSTSRRPTVTISPAGPYEPGQIVEVRGAGFQAHADDINIGWCRFHTANPATEAQGAGPEYASCAYPRIGVTTDQDGQFLLEDFPMPSGPFGAANEPCEEPTAVCGLAWHPNEGSHPVFITFFDLR